MGKAFSRFMAGQSEPPPPAPPRRLWQCICNGCPVTAGIEASGGDTICRFHDGAAPETWHEITRRLRMREWIVRLADYCASGNPSEGWAERADALTRRNGRPDLAPNRSRRLESGAVRDETRYPLLYAQRLNAELARECVSKRAAPPLPRRDSEPVPVASALPVELVEWAEE